MNYNLLNPEVLIYALSLAFQVAGAVLLILKYWGRTEERIIEEYFPGRNIVDRDDNDMVTLEKEKIQLCARKIYNNRISFLYIAVGYVLSIFGNISSAWKIGVLLEVILFTVILLLLDYIVVLIISSVIYQKDIQKPYDDISHLADTVVTEKEMEDMLEDVFGKTT